MQKQSNVSDDEQTEAIVTGADGRCPVYDFSQEFKSNNIYNCIGQLMVSYDYNETHGFRLNKVIGTATVFCVQPDIESDEKGSNIAYVFTAAHNIRFPVIECITHKRYRKKYEKCPICKHGKNENDQREILLKPTKILFMRRSMKFNNCGCPEASYKCFTVYLEENKYALNRARRAGFDWAIIGFNDDGFYEKNCKNIEFQAGTKAFLNGQEIAIFGYPYNNEHKTSDYYKMYGMKTKAMKQFEIKKHINTDRYYIVQRGIDTDSGQSGSALWFIENGIVFIVGVHVGGKPVTSDNPDAYNIAVAVGEHILKQVEQIKSRARNAYEISTVNLKLSKLLTEWGLKQYVDIMQKEGWTEPEYWTDIDHITFQKVLKFKSGHIAKFKRKLSQMNNEPSKWSGTMKVKLVLLGDTRVGKSSVYTRFMKYEFNQYRTPTIGATFETHIIFIDDCQVKFEIWDTAGQEQYRSLARMYYRGATVAVVVYDITNKESFDNAKKWIEEIQEYEDCLIVLAGNKVDLEENRVVSKEEAHEYAKGNKFIFLETSAKNGTNIKELFRAAAQELIRQPEFLQHANVKRNPVIATQKVEQMPKKKRLCC